MTIYSLYSLLYCETVSCPMFGSKCPFLTHIQVSKKTGKGVWHFCLSKNFPQFVVTHRVKDYSIVNEAEIDDFFFFFLESPCFLYDPMNVDNLIAGSSTYKPSLYMWKFLVHVLLKLSLKYFEHNLDSMWNECNCTVTWTFHGLFFFRIGMKTDLFQSCGHWWIFQICWHIVCSTFTVSSFRIWNSSAGIPSPQLALFEAMLPKTHLISKSRMFSSRGMTTPS